jgi:uncharacterized protein YaiE (UPF0345 family)
MPIGVGYVGLGKEATFGTAVAPAVFVPVKDADITTDPQVYYPEEIRNSRAKAKGIPMGLKHETSLSLDMEPSNLGHILLGALGAVATTQPDAVNAATVYQHSFTPANAIPSYTVERYDTVLIQRAAGCKVDTLTLSVEAGGDGVLSGEVAFKNKSVVDQAAAATPSYNDKTAFAFHGITVSKGGAANGDVRSMELEIANNLKDDRYALTTSKEIVDLPEGMREVTGSVEMYFKNKQDWINFKAGSKDSLTITFEGAVITGAYKEKLILELPSIQYDAFEIPMGGADDEIMASLEFTALYSSASGFEVKAVLTNTVSSY